MSRFRRIRRNRHDDRKSTQAADRGASQARGAGGNAGAVAWSNSPGQRFHSYANSYQNIANQGLNAYLSQNSYTQSVPQQMQALTAQSLAQAHQAWLLQANNMKVLRLMSQPNPEPLPREIRAGEIIGYRAWIKGADDSYWSTARPVQWIDGRMDGEVKGDYTEHSGVHAWKSRARAFSYADDFVKLGFDIAIGEVLLWGDVVEHEDGYRAEHAEIGKIYRVIESDLDENTSYILSINYYSHGYAHIPRRPALSKKPARPVETTAPWATPAKLDPITIAGWAMFAWLAAFCVMISTGAMSPF